MSSKYKLFSAAMRSILCYGAQVWGISPYEEVESLLRLFLKKIFRLPRFTPNRMLYLETGLSPLHIFTAEMHFRYIQKVVTMPEHRLPRILANLLVQERKQWVIEWETLAETYGERLQLGDPSQWSQWAKNILVHMDETNRTQFKNGIKEKHNSDVS